MAENIEPVIRKDASGGSIPLNTAGPLNLAGADKLKAAGACHFDFKEVKVLDFSAGKAQGTYPLFYVQPGTFVKAIRTVVLTAVNASTTITIGDGGSAARFLANADIVPQTVNTVANSLLATAPCKGYYYPTGDTIDYVLGTADATAGKLLVEIEYVEQHRFTAQAA